MADTDALEDVPRQRLRELIAQYGPSLCDNPSRFEGLLLNLCAEHRREVFVLTSVLRAGLVADIQKALEGGSRGTLLTTIIQQMHETLSISEEMCQWAVESWTQALAGAAMAPPTEAAKAEATLPTPSPEHRRIAAAQFDRANQAITAGNYDYGIQLLLTCCKLDPGNLIYRQALRRTEKTKFKNNMRGSRMAAITSGPARAKLKSVKRSKEYLKVLELGEEMLARNPWDTGTQLDMAEAADALGAVDLAIWILLQARQKDANDVSVNRALARLYEQRGNYTQAIGLWELVRQADPQDVEARQKAKDLAANQTIEKGQYHDAVLGQPRARKDSDTHKAPETKRVSLPPVAARLARETETLLKKLETDPANANVYLQLASAYKRAGEMGQALEIMRKGLAACGPSFQMNLELAELELEPLRRDLTVAEEKLKADPKDEELRKIRHRLLKEINSRELELFRQKADRFPTEMNHRLELGIRLLRANQVDEAIRELQAAKADARLAWRSLLFLGYCFKARNNWKLAQRNFDESLKSLPASEDALRKEILFQLANGYAEAGDLALALEHGNELANLDFSYRNIGRLLDDWQQRMQQA